MDIHRCRFVPYPPASISALAFSHTSDLSQKAPSDLRLAVGRDNSDIEIWHPRGGSWLQESTLRGTVGSTVEQLVWTQDLVVDNSSNETIVKPGNLRLFSIGGSQSVTEWSLTTGRPVRHAEGTYRNIWCIAAQPSYSKPKDGKFDGDVPSQYLAAGCADGTVVLFSTSDSDLRYSQILHAPPAKKAKVLSITWRDRNTVVAGYEDGFIRVLDVPSRAVIRQMTLGKSADGTRNIVWTVKCLRDGTILSGDSGGELKIWDPQNFSLAQKLKSHEADVLDIVPSAKGDLIFTVGVDRRTIVYQSQPMAPGQKRKRWAPAIHRRYHDHDVKCAIGYESKGLSVLVSGGMDASPVMLPISNWKSEYHRTLPHLPSTPQMSTSRNRLVLTWWGREMNIYLIPKRTDDGEMSEGIDDYVLLATLQLKGGEHIQSAHISSDGKFVVASTINGVRLFQLRQTSAAGALAIRSRAVALPPTLESYGARKVGFSPDEKWIYAVRFDNTVLLAKMTAGTDAKELPSFHSKIVRLEPTAEESDGLLGDYTDAVSVLAFSPDSRVLAVGTLAGHITSWTLEGHEDLTSTLPTSSSRNSSPASGSESDSDNDSDTSTTDDSPSIHAQRWTRTPPLPRLDSSILLLVFRPTSYPQPTAHTHNHHLQPLQSNIALHPTRHTPNPIAHEHPIPPPLLALTATHALHELSLTTGTFTPWSRRNPPSLLRDSFTRLKDRAMGAFMHGQRLWLYGSSWVYMMDLSRDFALQTSPTGREDSGKGTSDTNRVGGGKKRKREAKGRSGAGDLIRNRKDREGIGATKVVRYTGKGEGRMEVVDLEKRAQDADVDMDGAEEDALGEELVRLRRQEEGKSEEGGEQQQQHDGPTQWLTHRYRAIFGIGVLSSSDELQSDAAGHVAGNGNGDVAMQEGEGTDTPAAPKRGIQGDDERLEVVIVERPMYEVAQAPRFDGGQDWDA